MGSHSGEVTEASSIAEEYVKLIVCQGCSTRSLPTWQGELKRAAVRAIKVELPT